MFFLYTLVVLHVQNIREIREQKNTSSENEIKFFSLISLMMDNFVVKSW